MADVTGFPTRPRWLGAWATGLLLTTGLGGFEGIGAEGVREIPSASASGEGAVWERDLSEDFVVREWRTTEGLPDDRVNSLLASSDGYLWVGTFAGLARFDGVRFVRFDHGNVPLLEDQRIQRVAEGGDGRLWVQPTDGLLVAFGSRGWIGPRWKGNRIAAQSHLHVSASGKVWMQTDSGWMHPKPFSSAEAELAGDVLEVWRPDADITVLDVAERADGERISAGLNSVTFHVGTNRSEIALPEGSNALERMPVARVLESASGGAWLIRGGFAESTPMRLYRVWENRVVKVDDSIPVPPHWPMFLIETAEEAVWHPLGAGKLALTSANGRRGRYRLAPGRAGDFAVDAAKGAQGDLWVGLDKGGLLRLTPRRFSVAGRTQGLPHPEVRALWADEPGEVWIGTADGVARAEVGSDHRIRSISPVGLSGTSVRALARTGQGTLWVGTSRGLFERREGEWREHVLPQVSFGVDGDGLGSRKVRDLLGWPDGSVWVVTPRQVAVRPADGSATWNWASLPRMEPTDLFRDRSGNVWLSTARAGVLVFPASGLGVTADSPQLPVPDFHPDQWRVAPVGWIRAKDGLGTDQAWEVCEDRTGTVWIAGARGLLRLPAAVARGLASGGGIPLGTGARPELSPFLFTPRSGMPELAVNSLVEDGFGALWIGGDRGIFRIPLHQFEEELREKRQALSLEAFTVRDGLLSEETHGRISHPAAIQDPAGRVWFGTTNGVVWFPPQFSMQADFRLRVAIEEVRSDGRVLATTLPQTPLGGPMRPHGSKGSGVGGGLREEEEPTRHLDSHRILPAGQGRVMEIRYTGFDYTAPGALHFRYQLLGYDAKAHEAGDRRVAYYTHLDPGTYTFRVWARSQSGVWSEAPAEYRFTLQPFLWQTLWFRVTAGLVAVVCLGGGVMLRVRRVRAFESLRRRAEQAELRSRLARDLHDGVGSGLARLALLSSRPLEAEPSAESVEKQFRELSAAVRDLAQTVREISWNANPAPIPLEDLVAQMAQLAGEFLGAAGITCRTELPLELPRTVLTPEQRVDLYFTSKEALTNVARHSGATEAWYRVSVVGGDLKFEIGDNGRGFEPGVSNAPRPSRSGGNGLRNLGVRVASLGGQWECDSSPGRGTRILLKIPLRGLGKAWPRPG